jgi:hypothetical protein
MAVPMLHARTLSIAVLSAAALAAGGCGGDSGGGGGGGGDDESQIRDVITSYASAVADRDGDKACGYLTDTARKQIEAIADSIDAEGCAGVMEKLTEQASKDDRDQLKDLKVTSVKVEGDRATVQVEAAGEKGDPSTVVKQDGDWKIDAQMGGGTATAEKPTAATVTRPSPVTTP